MRIKTKPILVNDKIVDNEQGFYMSLKDFKDIISNDNNEKITTKPFNNGRNEGKNE